MSGMKKLIPILFGGAGASTLLGDVGLAILRVGTGLLIAAHGLPKIPPSEGFIGMVEGLGFPAPALAAWGAGITELVGGVLLALGLLTRPVALALVGNMAVAAFLAHADDPLLLKPTRIDGAGYYTAGKEFALLYLLPFVAFALLGAGKTGVDMFIRKGK
ncbi:MAG: DoxX family protein [Planctomycetota bacterium]